jgi:murein DD-endopeptidase MepM/ murein hydrolase activator NlpD
MARTLRAMYVRGTPTSAEVVLQTNNVRYALSHFKYMGLVARNNERLLREIREQERYLAATDARLTETLYEISTNADETRDERDRLGEIRRSRQSVLQRVRRQRADYQAALADLTAAERKVQSVIALLEKRRQQALASGRGAEVFPDVGFAKLRGSMPWPARGRVRAGYGRMKNPRHGTETFNSGIDIAATEGADVRCVARGQVEYVKWMDGYGNTIIVNHGGGYYTVYAHLSEALVSESLPVEPGHVIGRVGDTGSLDGPKLHFEVRAGEHGDPVDPLRWLSR